MITREMVIAELRKKGYQVQARNKVKNSVTVEGIEMKKDEHVGVFISLRDLIPELEKEHAEIYGEHVRMPEVIRQIERLYANADGPEICLEDLKNRDFILRHINIALQKKGVQDLIKKPCPYFGGTEQYLYLTQPNGTEGHYFVEVSSALLNGAGVSEEEAWEAAEKNLHESVVIESMDEIFKRMTGSNMDFLLDDDETYIPMYVISNKNSAYGAAAVLDDEILKEFAVKHHANCLMLLPSSIHEVMIVPHMGEYKIEDMRFLVRSVNASDVAPHEQLSDEPYLWRMENR